MPGDLELLGRLLLAAVLGGAIGAERELNDQPCRAARAHAADHRACLVTLVSAYGFGAGQYLLGVGGALLVSVTLLGLRRVGARCSGGGVARGAGADYPPELRHQRIVEVTRDERVELRGLDRQESDGEDRIALVVKLWPRLPDPSSCSTCSAAWTACARSNGSGDQASPRRSESSGGSQVRPTRNGPKRP
jgi:hypothetical protein